MTGERMMDRAKPGPTAAWLIVVTLLVGCRSAPAKPNVYKMVGTVVSVQPETHQATINHQDIPGFMGAMTMPYAIKDQSEFGKLSAGDDIKADVLVDKETGGVWLSNIEITRHVSATPGEKKNK